MFNVGPEKLLLLLFIALVVLGPKRLPDAARAVGRAVGEMRRLSGHIQEEVHGALAEPTDALTAAVGDLRRELGDLNAFGLRTPATGTPGEPASSASPPTSVSSSTSSGSTVPEAAPSLSTSPLPPSPDDPSLN